MMNNLIDYAELDAQDAIIDADDSVEVSDAFDEWIEGPCCSICDGLGHGYPGGPPCPLEDRGGYDDER